MKLLGHRGVCRIVLLRAEYGTGKQSPYVLILLNEWGVRILQLCVEPQGHAWTCDARRTELHWHVKGPGAALGFRVSRAWFGCA